MLSSNLHSGLKFSGYFFYTLPEGFQGDPGRNKRDGLITDGSDLYVHVPPEKDDEVKLQLAYKKIPFTFEPDETVKGGLEGFWEMVSARSSKVGS